jgi:hypothetical protein
MAYNRLALILVRSRSSVASVGTVKPATSVETVKPATSVKLTSLFLSPYNFDSNIEKIIEKEHFGSAIKLLEDESKLYEKKYLKYVLAHVVQPQLQKYDAQIGNAFTGIQHRAPPSENIAKINLVKNIRLMKAHLEEVELKIKAKLQ